MGQPPLDTSRPDLSRPTGQEPQPVEPTAPLPPPDSPVYKVAQNLRERFNATPGWSWEQVAIAGWAEIGSILAQVSPEPCPPPASQPAAEPAEPSAPSQEGSGSAGGVEVCCKQMQLALDYRHRGDPEIELVTVNSAYNPPPAHCLWCGAKLGEGEL